MKDKTATLSKISKDRLPPREVNLNRIEFRIEPVEKLRDVDCEVTIRDINGMVDNYDSGMCDITTHNAAALALKRRVKEGHVVRILRDGPHGKYVCRIDDHKFLPSSDMEEIFSKLERGLFAEGFHFHVTLPEDLVEPLED